MYVVHHNTLSDTDSMVSTKTGFGSDSKNPLSDHLWSKLSVSECKTILISWIYLFSSLKFLFYEMVTWTNRICALGLRLSLMSISIPQFVWRKKILGALWVAVALSCHTGSSMQMNVRKLWTQSDTWNQWEENSCRCWRGGNEWRWILWFISAMEQHLIAPIEYVHLYFLGDRLIFRRTNNPWPAHFPHRSPLDYFLWGYLNDRACANNPQTIDTLKNNIRTEIRRILHEMLDRVIINFNMRVATVIQRNELGSSPL